MTDMQAYALRTDGQDEPQGVVTAPTFSWRLRSEHRGARQTSYRLLVHLHTPAGQHVQVWDSGEVAGSTTVGVRYQGAPLQTSADYSWHLEVSDEAGRRTTASSRFATGIVHPCEWQGLWIGRNPDEQKTALPPQDTDISYTVNKLRPVRRFVRHLDLEDVPARAKVHASAKGNYRLYINGHKVGTDELTPGWTEYRDRICYQSWDVTQLLRPGRNSIAALLADGWYVGFIGTDRRHQAQHYGEEPELLVQLVSDAANGERTVIGTDSQWQQQPSDILYADQLMGQYEDSRQANPDWHLPATDVTGWSYAVVTDQDHTRLVPESDPGVRVTGRLPARRVLRRSPDRHIVDFGQNLVGRVRLVIRGQAEGTRVQLTHAEVLDADGELYTENLRTAEPVDVFWTDGSPEQVFEPRFTFHGFRYVQISGLNGELTAADIEAVVLHNGFDMVGEFSSSSADLDQLFSNISWGLRGNFLSIPTDCPQRDERLGWLADAQVFAPTALALADVGPLLRRWLKDVRSAQNDDGAFPDIAPHLIHLREGAPAWGDGGVTIPWAVYRATGEVSVLVEAAESMIAWVRHLQRHNSDLIWRNQLGNNYGDWLQIGEETRKDVLATAYFARSADLTARTLHVLGRTHEAEEFDVLAGQVRQAFRREFLDQDGTVAGDTQGGYLLTLAFGLCESGSQQQLVAEKLVQAVQRRGVSLTTGFITVGMLCPVLAQIGREDLAFRLLHSDRYPSWLYSIRNGATTIWERWDGWTAESGFQSARMNSFNHYSLGSVGQWFISGILGIDQLPESAGYRSALLRPRFDLELDWAAGGLETTRGRFESQWQRHGEQITWQLAVPPGAPVQAFLPATSASVREGEDSATSCEAMNLLQEDTEGSCWELLPGRYRLTFPVAS